MPLPSARLDRPNMAGLGFDDRARVEEEPGREARAADRLRDAEGRLEEVGVLPFQRFAEDDPHWAQRRVAARVEIKIAARRLLFRVRRRAWAAARKSWYVIVLDKLDPAGSGISAVSLGPWNVNGLERATVCVATGSVM